MQWGLSYSRDSHWLRIRGPEDRSKQLPPIAAQPVLEVSQRLPEYLENGVPFPIEITVRNSGTATAEGVVLKDHIPEGYEAIETAPLGERYKSLITWSLGRIAPGEQRALLLRLAPLPGGSPPAPRNAIDASFEGRVASVAVGKFKSAELVLMVDAPKTAFVGQPVAVKMTLRNVGLMPAKNIVLMTNLPDGLTHPAGPELESNLGVLAPGTERSITLEAMTMRSGDFRIRVRAQAEKTPSVENDASVRAEDIRLLLTAKAWPATLQQQFTGLFEIEVRNEGTSTSPKVAVNMALSDGLAYVRANEGGAYDSRNHSVHWELGDMKPGEVRVIAWNGVARRPGSLDCKVLLTSDQRAFRDATWTTKVAPNAKAVGTSGTEDK